MNRSRLLVAWLGLALVSGAGGTAWAAFGATTQSATMTWTTKPDETAPVISAATEYREGGGTAHGSIRQGGTYRISVAATDMGDPPSLLGALTADVSSFDAGQTAVALSVCDPACTVSGSATAYTHQSAVLTADTPQATGSTPSYTVRAPDLAGNVSTQSFNTTIETYAAAISATPGIVSHWRLGETVGTTAADARNVNPGTLVGSPLQGQADALVGDGDAAILLDGVDDYVNIPDSTTLDRADGPFTLEAWVRLSDADPGSQEIFSKGLDSWSVAFGTAAGQFGLHKDGTGPVASYAGTANTADYKHFVVTKSGVTTKLYVNGVDVTGTPTNQTLLNTALPLMLGRNANASGGSHLRGWLDEPAIYNQALSASRVLDHYKAGMGTG